jgi:cation:H+ antiporter
MGFFSQLGLTANLLFFTVAAVAVWCAGARLTLYAEEIRRVTKLGQAFVGIVLLAGVTSLPEIGVTATAAVAGNAQLAVNNLFGSIALQVAMLAVVDFFVGRRALTAVVPEPAVMLEGSLNIILTSVAGAAIVVGDIAVLGAGAWAWSLIVAYFACVWILSHTEGRQPWLAARNNRVDRRLIEGQNKKDRQERPAVPGSLAYRILGVGSVILIAGFILAQSGEAIAEQSGLGSSFVGFVLVALATSLPELSTALTAARRGLVTMAISDILGTNMINIGLVFFVDLLDSGDPVLGRVGSFAAFGAFLAIVLTAIFQAGLAERRDRGLLRMGYDSILVLIVYAVGVALLYGLRDLS